MDDRKYKSVFANLPILETERLIMKKIEMKNAYDMYSYASEYEVSRFLLWTPHVNLDETKGLIEYLVRQYKRGSCFDWGLNLKESGEFVGTCGFASVDMKNNKAEIGYVLSHRYRGKGYMTEAVNEVLRVAFILLGLNRVEARIMEGNQASIRFAAAKGFRHEGTAINSLLVKGEYKTIHQYAMLSRDYFK